jgi:hypothetical protein
LAMLRASNCAKMLVILQKREKNVLNLNFRSTKCPTTWTRSVRRKRTSSWKLSTYSPRQGKASTHIESDSLWTQNITFQMFIIEKTLPEFWIIVVQTNKQMFMRKSLLKIQNQWHSAVCVFKKPYLLLFVKVYSSAALLPSNPHREWLLPKVLYFVCAFVFSRPAHGGYRPILLLLLLLLFLIYLFAIVKCYWYYYITFLRHSKFLIND